MDAEQISEFIAYTAYYMIVVSMFLTLIVMLLKGPRSKFEWASVSIIGSFNLILWRSLYVAVTGHLIPQPYGAIFWMFNVLLVGVYLWVLLGEYLTPIIIQTCEFCVKHKVWVILAIIVLSLIFARFTFHLI